MDIFIEWFNGVWKRPPNEIERILGLPETDPERIAELTSLMDEWLDFFESMLHGIGEIHIALHDFSVRLTRLAEKLHHAV